MKKRLMLSLMLTLMVIMCPIGSVLSAHGVDQSFYIKGDVDGNGVVNISDATLIQKILAQIVTPTDEMLKRAKVTGKNDLTIDDATAIQKYVSKYKNVYSIGEKVYVNNPETQPQLVVDKVSAAPGAKDVAINVSVKNNPGIASLAFDVDYDTNAMTLTNFSYNEKIVDGSSTVPFNPKAQPTCLSIVNGSKNINGDWVFATLYFDIKDSAKGKYPITLKYDNENIYNIDEQDIEFDVVSGEIAVSSVSDSTEPATQQKEYTVTFKDSNGKTIAEQKVKDGEMLNYPDPPVIDGYVFKKWDKTLDSVTGDTVITAVYEEATNGPVFVIDSVDAEAGSKNVAVNISVKNNPGVSSILMEIIYDKDNLTLTNFEYNTDALVGCSTVPFNANAFATCLNMVNGTQNVKGDWTFATLYFDVKPTAQGSCPITVSFDEDNVYNIDEDNIPFAITDGAINAK